MADEEEEEGTKEEEAEAGKEVVGKSKKKLFLIIGGLIILLIAIGTPIVIMSMGEDEAVPNELDKNAAEVHRGLDIEGFEDEDEYEEDEEPIGAVFPLETFVVNLSGGGYLRCQTQLEFQSREVPKRYYVKSVPVRDALITLFSTQSGEKLRTEKGRRNLKEAVKQTVNELLRREEVKQVYFTQFVVQ